MRRLDFRSPASIDDPQAADRAWIVVGVDNGPPKRCVSELSIDEYLSDDTISWIPTEVGLSNAPYGRKILSRQIA